MAITAIDPKDHIYGAADLDVLGRLLSIIDRYEAGEFTDQIKYKWPLGNTSLNTRYGLTEDGFIVLQWHPRGSVFVAKNRLILGLVTETFRANEQPRTEEDVIAQLDALATRVKQNITELLAEANQRLVCGAPVPTNDDRGCELENELAKSVVGTQHPCTFMRLTQANSRPRLGRHTMLLILGENNSSERWGSYYEITRAITYLKENLPDLDLTKYLLEHHRVHVQAFTPEIRSLEQLPILKSMADKDREQFEQKRSAILRYRDAVLN